MATEITTQVTMEGDLVTIREIKTVKQAALSDFLPLLTTRLPIHIPALPANISHINANPLANGDTEIDLLIENIPQPRHIAHQASERSIKNYRLAMPWVYFLFNMFTSDPAIRTGWTCKNWKVFWSPMRLIKMEDPVYRAFVPNVYEDGRICFGNLGRAGNTSLAEFVNGTVNTFWTSNFNNHLQVPYPGGYKDFKEWEKATETSETCWETWPELREHETGSLRSIFNNRMERFAPIIIPGTIPEIPMPLTFESIDRWYDMIDETNKQRMRDHIAGGGQYTLRPRM